jgi:hypothetical protein
MSAISCNPSQEATTQPASQPAAAAATQNKIPYALIDTCIKQIKPYAYTMRQLASFSTNHPPVASRITAGITVIYHEPYQSLISTQPKPGVSKLTFIDRTSDLMLVLKFQADTKKVLGVSTTDALGYAKTIKNPKQKAIYYLKKTQDDAHSPIK